jgi:hypothetical protein
MSYLLRISKGKNKLQILENENIQKIVKGESRFIYGLNDPTITLYRLIRVSSIVS